MLHPTLPLPSRIGRSLILGVLSGLGPLAVVIGVAMVVRGEAFWIIPTLVLGVPTVALAGAVATFWVLGTSASRFFTLRVWLLTTLGGFLPVAACTYASMGVLTKWVAAPALAGAVLGALPATMVARAGWKQERRLEPAA